MVVIYKETANIWKYKAGNDACIAKEKYMLSDL